MGRSLHEWERKAEKMEDLDGRGRTNICLINSSDQVAFIVKIKPFVDFEYVRCLLKTIFFSIGFPRKIGK